MRPTRRPLSYSARLAALLALALAVPGCHEVRIAARAIDTIDRAVRVSSVSPESGPLDPRLDDYETWALEEEPAPDARSSAPAAR